MRSKYSPRRIAFLMAGCLALILGIVGAFLPILPTTPFMLLAAFCFARSSQKAFCWLMTHSLFGFKIYSYSVTHAIPKGVKWKIFFVLWISLFISMLFIPLWWVRILLVGVGVGVTIHIARLRTIAPEEIALYKEQYEAYKARWECNRKNR